MGVQVFVHLSWVILMLALKGVVVAKVLAAGHECRMARCSHHGPEIRFPFWIKDKQPEQCGYPGFQVFCRRGKTLLHFQYLANTSLHQTLIFLSKNVSILRINYTSQNILVDGYPFTNNLKLVSTSTSFGIVHPFYYYYDRYNDPNTTFVSCSSRIKGYIPDMLTSLDGKTFPVYCLNDFQYTSERSISSCTKVFNSSLTYDYLRQEEYASSFFVRWSTPNCGICEAKGEDCMLKNSSSSNIEAADNSTICLPKGI